MAEQFKHDVMRFDCLGLDLNNPLDRIAPGKFPILKNVRSYQQGRIEPRFGLTSLGNVVSSSTPVHSVRRLDDAPASTWTRIVGTGTKLAYGQSPFTSCAVGFSGKPLSLVPCRPSQATSAWMYVGDSSRTVKVNSSGTVHSVGLPAPVYPPTQRLAHTYDYTISDTETASGWTKGGTAGAISLLDYRCNTTVMHIGYESGSTGWCTVVPTAVSSSMQVGAHVRFDPGGANEDTGFIYEVLPAITSCTIKGVLYDSGSSGLCNIQLEQAVDGLQPYSLVNISAITYVEVVSVTSGPDGVTSFRCSTGASTALIGDTVTGMFAFRTHVWKTHIAAEVLQANGLQSAVTKGTAIAYFTGDRDLTKLTSSSNNRASYQDDYIRVMFRIDDPSVFKEGRVMFDVDSATNDFSQNFYYYPFVASDLEQVLSETTTTDEAKMSAAEKEAIQDRINKRLTGMYATRYPNQSRGGRPMADAIAHGRGGTGGASSVADSSIRSASSSSIALANSSPYSRRSNPGTFDPASQGRSTIRRKRDTGANDIAITLPGNPFYERTIRQPNRRSISGTTYTQQLYAGDKAWNVITFRVSDLIRVGTDLSRTLANVKAFGMDLQVTAPTTVAWSTWLLQGGFGPDVTEDDMPYYYRYRGRCSTTGVRSNYSPASMAGALPHRTGVNVYPLQHPSTECDVLDIERLGGTLTTWQYVGSTINNASPVFLDVYPDTTIAVNASEGQTNYQPWLVIGSPTSGTADTVCGINVYDSSAVFNVSWAPGTTIFINGIPYTINRMISTSKLELTESAGYQTSIGWDVYEPYLMQQNLPAIFGPYEGYLFGVGDSYNPGVIYWTNRNNADGMTDTNWFELCAPSEPLMNGCVFNGRCYVWSSDRMFQILPAFDTADTWRFIEVPNGRGLFSRWALTGISATEGPAIWFLGKDGIYQTEGSTPVSVTDKDMFPLFPNEGNLGSTVNGIAAPNIVTANAAYLRMSFYDDFVYFDYKDTSGYYRTLVYNTITQGWFWDVYTPGITYHYGEEGKEVHSILCCGSDSTTGKLYSLAGLSDSGTAIACQVRTPCRDQGLPRNYKVYGDYIVDADTATTDVSVVAGFGNYATTVASTTINTSSRDQSIINLASGAGYESRNIALDLTYSASSTRPLLYLWDIGYLEHPENTDYRFMEWDEAGSLTDKWVQGILIEADTYNTAKTVYVQDENGTTKATLTVTHNGRVTKPYSWPGFFSHMMRLAPADTTDWQLFTWKWIFEPAPELTTTWETPDMTHGIEGYQHIRDGYIAHVSSANITLTVTIDGTAYAYTITHGSSAYKKSYLVFQPVKGKAYRYKLTSASAFRLYKQDCEIRGKEWKGQGPYHTLRPFGGISVTDGAAI